MTSLVFPTYNPGPAVDATVSAALDLVRARPDPWEVLFVCDGCTDGTPERLDRLLDEAGDPRVRALSYPANRGKGYAVRVGLLAARGDVRLFTDVDLHYFEAVPRVAAALRAGGRCVVASRYHPDSRLVLPFGLLPYAVGRRVQSWAFVRLVRTLLPVRASDTQAGLKGMTAAVAEAVVPNLACDGFAFDGELLAACGRYGIPVAEVPVTVRYDDASTSTGGLTAARMVRQLWRVRRRWAADAFPPPAAALARPALARAA